MGKFVEVSTTDERADQPAKCIEVGGEKIALFNVGGVFYALSDTCTHRGGPLSEGGAEMTCPWHGTKFDLRTGAVSWPPAGTGVKSYPVKVTGSDIEIEL